MIYKFKRVLQLIRVSLKYLLLPRLPFSAQSRVAPAVLVRMALEELGGTWIKLGQALALRFDILAPEYCYEFFKLLNEVKPFPADEAIRIIQEDLGGTLEQLFSKFDREPFAAASIGQVHRAVLPTGEEVAVKVRRPRIVRLIHTDLALMYDLAGVLDLFELFGATRFSELINQFSRWTLDELDFRIEMMNGTRLRSNAAGDPLEHDARMFPRYCSRRVLTCEFIGGVPLIRVVYAIRDRDEEYLRELRDQGLDPLLIARHLCWNVMNQIYQFGFFHADLHPANIFVMPGNRLAYIDFGIVGRLSAQERESLAHWAWHLYRGETELAVEEFFRWIKPSPGTDLNYAKEQLTKVLDDYIASLKAAGGAAPIAPPAPDLESNGQRPAYGHRGTAEFETNILTAIRQHKLILSQNATLYFKATMTTVAVVYDLAPEYNLQKDENRFFSRVVRNSFSAWLNPEKIGEAVYEYGFQIRRLLANTDIAADVNEQLDKAKTWIRTRVLLFGFLGALALLAAYFTRQLPLGFEKLPASVLQSLPYFLAALAVLCVTALFHQMRKDPRLQLAVNHSQRMRQRLKSSWDATARREDNQEK